MALGAKPPAPTILPDTFLCLNPTPRGDSSDAKLELVSPRGGRGAAAACQCAAGALSQLGDVVWADFVLGHDGVLAGALPQAVM